MPFNPYPGGGGPDWEGFTGRIEARFGQQMRRPVWLWPSPTADLPTDVGMGANEGALAYDDTLNAPTFYTGSAWKQLAYMGGGAALTKTDDTNVTLTLGGAPTTALLGATSITVGWSGQLAAGRGGTGIASYAVGDLIYASGATTLSKLADVATGNALISGGVTTAPSWGKIGLTTHVSGTLGPGNGGTGITSLGTGVATALGVNVGSAGAFVTFNGALGTPSSGTATNLTGLPISTGVSGLGTGVAAFLATPTSANLAAAVTDETGSGALVFASSPTLAGTVGMVSFTASGISSVSNQFTVASSGGGGQLYIDFSGGGNNYNDANGTQYFRTYGGATRLHINGTSTYLDTHSTTASAANAFIDSSTGQISRSTSSARYKRNIEGIEDKYLDAALKLRPVWYQSTSPTDNPDWGHWGFIAEEAAKVDPRLVHWTYRGADYETVKGPDGEKRRQVKEGAQPTVPESFQYERLTVMLLGLVQRLEARVAVLEAA